MAIEVKKFLDQQGVGTLWARIAEKIAAEKVRAEAAEQANAAAIKVIADDYLKAADKTALESKIDLKANQVDLEAEVQRASGIEAGLRTDVDAIKADYLKAADKTALESKIDLKADATALAAEAERATGVEAGLRTDIDAVVADYLKAADKTELSNAIAAEKERAEAAEAGLQTQINTIVNNPDAEGAINSINEFTKYIEDHGEIAEGFRTSIAANTKAIEDHVALAAETYETKANAAATLETVNAAIALKADASALESAVEALEGADAAIIERLTAAEALLGDGNNSVSDIVAAALEEAKTDASNKDVVVLAEAQKASNAVQSALDTHANNADIHVTTADKAKWNAAEDNAKAHADSLNTAMSTRVETIEKDWHLHFASISDEEINALFV